MMVLSAVDLPACAVMHAPLDHAPSVSQWPRSKPLQHRGRVRRFDTVDADASARDYGVSSSTRTDVTRFDNRMISSAVIPATFSRMRSIEGCCNSGSLTTS